MTKEGTRVIIELKMIKSMQRKKSHGGWREEKEAGDNRFF